MYKITINLPGTNDQNIELSDHEKINLLNSTQTAISDIAGGCTSIPYNGSWKDNQGIEIKESSYIVYTLVSDSDLESVYNLIIELCQGIKEEYNQDCILVSCEILEDIAEGIPAIAFI